MTTEKYQSLISQYGSAKAALTAIMDGQAQQVDFWKNKKPDNEFSPDEYHKVKEKHAYAKGALIATRTALALIEEEQKE